MVCRRRVAILRAPLSNLGRWMSARTADVGAGGIDVSEEEGSICPVIVWLAPGSMSRVSEDDEDKNS